MAVQYDMTPGNYKLSPSFELVNSEIAYKEAAIKDFIIDGDKLVKEKQEKLDKELKVLYHKDEESGRIFEQHGHYYESTVNESLQEAFLLAATSYLYSQFEFYLSEISNRTKEQFNSQSEIKREPKNILDKSKISKFYYEIVTLSAIDVTDLDSYWSKIKLFKQARHCIVHSNGGHVKSNHRGLKEIPESTVGLTYDEKTDRITINKEYLLELNKICFDFLNKIMEKVWAKRFKS